MKKNKVIVSVLLVLALVLNGVFAVSFPDVKDDWSKPYIDRIAGLGILTGYSDGTFRPNGDLTKYQTIVVLYRTLVSQKLVDVVEVANLKNKYASVLTTNNVPTWPDLPEAVAFFLERGVIKSTELSTYIVNGKEAAIDRELVAQYVGRALNIYLKEDLSQLISVNLKDVNSISFEALKYINILNKYGIISGDSQGYYNPKGILNRAQLSKILATSIDALEKVDAPSEKTVEATVSAKLDDSNRVIFFEKGSTTASYTEVIDSSVTVLINNQPATYADLVLNLPVTLTYASGKLTKVTSTATVIAPKVVTGAVSSTVVFQGRGYIYYIDDVSGQTVSYEVLTNAPITSKGVTKLLTDLKKGDKVTLTISADKVASITYEVKEGKVSGVVKAVTVSEKPQLVVTVNGVDVTLQVSDTVKVTRNGALKTLSSLLAGDQVVVDTIFEVANTITATGVVVKEVGVISELKLGAKSEIVIKTAAGEFATYVIGDGAKITVDGVVKTVFDLRPNYTVEFKADSAVITELTASGKVAKDYLVGVVQTVYADLKVVVLNVEGQSINVTQTTATRFVTAAGGNFDFKTLKLGETLFVYGVRQDAIIQADLMLKLD